MNPNYLLLLGLALTLFLASISIFIFRPTIQTFGGTSRLTQFFLVALRLSIGWHFLVEGMDKLHNPSWSSEPYLREATGPLAPHFREMAGDRLIDKLTPGSDGSFPAELNVEWQAYLDSFTRFYELEGEQEKKAQLVFDEAKAKTLIWLKDSKKQVQKISEYPPPLMVSLTIAERVKEYHTLEARVRDIEENYLPRYGDDAFPKLKTAKANLNKWRGELKSDLDKQTIEFKQALRDQVLVDIAKNALPAEMKAKVDAKNPLPSLQTSYHQLLLRKASTDEVKLSPQAAKVFEYAVDRKKDKEDVNEFLPPPDGLRVAARPIGVRPLAAWKLLDWSDFFVKWGITLTGACLLLGFFTRTACVIGAGLLLMFFLAMPPLPGWPESPRAEGHYLFINKNIIEMLALLTLASTGSGRWAGLDGLFQFCCPGRWRNARASSNLEKVT